MAHGRPNDPKSAVIWEAFKAETEPRRTIRKRRARRPRQAEKEGGGDIEQRRGQHLRRARPERCQQTRPAISSSNVRAEYTSQHPRCSFDITRRIAKGRADSFSIIRWRSSSCAPKQQAYV